MQNAIFVEKIVKFKTLFKLKVCRFAKGMFLFLKPRNLNTSSKVAGKRPTRHLPTRLRILCKGMACCFPCLDSPALHMLK